MTNPEFERQKLESFFDSLGPWVSASDVADTLGVTEDALETMRINHEVLGVDFPDGVFYPIHQFRDGKIAPNLQPVWEIFHEAFESIQFAAAMFEPVLIAGMRTGWDCLWEDSTTSITEWARLQIRGQVRSPF